MKRFEKARKVIKYIAFQQELDNILCYLEQESKGVDILFRSTTVMALVKDGKAVIGGDGQVTLGNTVMKNNARKIRRIYDGKVLVGFAGSSADALTLFERFEGKLNELSGNLPRAAVELAKEWRMDKALRRLEALMIVCDRDNIYLISGTGDVIEPEENLVAIGSGGPYALASARSLLRFSSLEAKDIVQEALKITANICIYTNEQISTETLE